MIWPDLDRIPEEFVLYGGTAAALRFGHRKPRDFVFFSNSFPVSRLLDAALDLPFCKRYPSGISLREDQRSLTLKLYVRDAETYDDSEKYLKVILLSDRELVPGSVEEPDRILENNLKLASLMDIFAHKVWATANRSRAGDFIDVVEFIKQGYSLETAFGVSRSYAKKASKTWNIDVKKLREDYLGEASERFFSDAPEGAILKEAASNISLCRVFKRRIKMYDNLYDLKSGETHKYFQGSLSSGREKDIEDFISTHEWDYDPGLPKDPDRFLVFLLAFCPVSYYEDALLFGFTNDDFIRALENTPRDLFPFEADLNALRERFRMFRTPWSLRKYH
jgi:hypothetical protein